MFNILRKKKKIVLFILVLNITILPNYNYIAAVK